MKLPPFSLDDVIDHDDSKSLTQHRLNLINLEPDSRHTFRSFPSFEQTSNSAYANKGASSQRYRNQRSLRAMATSFQQRLPSFDLPDIADGHRMLSEKMTKHTSVIDDDTYDVYARKHKPKPAMFSPGVQVAQAQSKTKNKDSQSVKHSDKVKPQSDVMPSEMTSALVRGKSKG